MLSIKKVIGKDEKEVTLEDVYNKLCGISEAYCSIFRAKDILKSSAEVGLSNLFLETLNELEEMVNTCPDYGTFKEFEELDKEDKTSVRRYIHEIKDRRKAERGGV